MDLRRISWAAVTIAGVFVSDVLCAQVLRAKVSVKVVLDEGGHRFTEGFYHQDSQIIEYNEIANAVLAAGGADWRLDLVEIVEVGGIAQWYGPVPGFSTRDGIEAAAASDSETYRWRPDAINVYIVNELSDAAAVCSFPGGHDAIVLSNLVPPPPTQHTPEEHAFGVATTLWLHEIGHYFDLAHTQGRTCLGCDPENFSGTCHTTPGDDAVADTLPDLASPCWDQDDIARYSFAVDYASLSPQEQNQVDETVFNVMSYHVFEILAEGEAFLTAGQVARMDVEMHPLTGRRLDVLNLPRPRITVGMEEIVETQLVEFDGSSSTVDPAHAVATYQWDFGDGSTAEGELTSHTYTTPGVYTVRLTVTDDQGLWMIAEEEVHVLLDGEPPAPWISQIIGESTVGGGARAEDEGLLIQGAGDGFRSTSDAFQFVHQRVIGDFALTAQIARWQAEQGARLGLMVRESLAEGARHGTVNLLQSFSGFRQQFRRREVTDGSTRNVTGSAYETPRVWLRIERRGDAILGSISEDGSTWTDPKMIVELADFRSEVYVGVASASSSNSPGPTFATLSSLSLSRPRFIRGDCNGDGGIDVSDPISSLNDLFFRHDLEPLDCPDACNANADPLWDIADAIFLLNFLFLGGAAPAAPFPECGGVPGPAASIGCGQFGC